MTTATKRRPRTRPEVKPDPDAITAAPETTEQLPAGPNEHGQAQPALPGRYVLLHKDQIRVNPDNVRDDAQALPGIVENVKEDGVAGLLSPVIVSPLADELYELVDGEQRYWSIIEAGQEFVPSIVRDDLTDNREQIISMLRQVHRKDPTAAQQARGIHQLALAGMDDADISRRTGYTTDQVRAGRSVAVLDKGTTERAQALGLDLAQAASVAEFSDEPDTIEALLEQAEDGPFAFARAVEEIRASRRARDLESARRSELIAAGITVLTEYPGYSNPRIKEVSDLRDAAGERISDEAHAICPGHAVYLSVGSGTIRERPYCTDWRTHGHSLPSYVLSNTPRSGPMTEAEKAERQRVVANNKAMDAANTVRREWLANLLTAKTPPKGTAKLIAEMLAESGYVLSTWITGGRKMLDDLLSPGKTKRPGTSRVPARLSDARYAVISLATIAAAIESAITKTSWRSPDPTVAKWLQWCITNGFQVGAIEQLIIDGVNKPATNRRPKLTVVTTADPDPSADESKSQPDSDSGEADPPASGATEAGEVTADPDSESTHPVEQLTDEANTSEETANTPAPTIA